MAPALARIHSDALAGDFLPALGLSFLEHTYYPAALASPHATTLVALDAGAPCGFVTVAQDSPGFSRDVVRGRWPAMTRRALMTSLRRPSMARQCLEVAHSALFGARDSVPGEIVYIAVDERHRGRGIGRELIRAAESWLAERGDPRCRTKTLAANGRVIALYRALGWRVRNAERLIGRDYVVLVNGSVAP